MTDRPVLDAAACPDAATHTPCPTDYLAWHAWAETMAETHTQRQCRACGLYTIWTPKEMNMTFPAILTGSHAYGTPKPESDVDLVIRVTDPDTLDAIINAADPPTDDPVHKPSAVQFRTASFRFGTLNLIIAHTDDQYAQWAEGTRILRERAPVTREQACAVFQALRRGETPL